MKWLLLFAVVSIIHAQKITVSPPNWNLGTIASNDIKSKVFILKNTSNKQVKLNAILTKCTCIRYKMKETLLLPNIEIKVEVFVEPKGKSGIFEWMLEIGMDIGRSIKIPIFAKILPEKILSKNMINFGKVKKGSWNPEKIYLMCNKQKNFLLKSIKTNSSFIAKYKEATIDTFFPGKQRCYEIEVVLNENISFGHHSDEIILKTNISNYQEIKIPVFAYVIGDLTVSPNFIPLGVVLPKKKITKRITLYHNNSSKIKIINIKNKYSFINTHFQEVVLNEYFYIFVDIYIDKRTSFKGEFREVINVYTDCPTQKYIPIYLQGFIR